MRAHGILDPLPSWIDDYLAEHRLIAKLPRVFSREFTQTAVVPQGSLLGPYVFNMCVNDIVDSVKVNILMFADDGKIFQEISFPSDHVRLQFSLVYIQGWCILNHMKINTSKCPSDDLY